MIKHKHYMTKRMWITVQSHPLMIVELPITGLVSLCCDTILHTSWEFFSARFWSMALGICAYSAMRPLVRSGSDAG